MSGRRAAPEQLVSRLPLLSACAEAGVRAVDRALGAEAADALLTVRTEQHIDDTTYVPALVALIELDVSVEYVHLGKVNVAPARGSPRPAAEYIRLRLDLALSLDATMARENTRRRLLALATGERGRGFGPVTRARAVCLGLHEGLSPTEAVRLAREACELDETSPLPRLALAQALLVQHDGEDEAGSVGREVDRALARFDALLAAGRCTSPWDQVPILGAATRLYARIGRAADARAMIARVRALPDVVPEWVDTLERDRVDAAAGRPIRRGF